jgi:hypothetical protein
MSEQNSQLEQANNQLLLENDLLKQEKTQMSAIAIKDLRYSDGSGSERVGRNTRIGANLSDY